MEPRGAGRGGDARRSPRRRRPGSSRATSSALTGDLGAGKTAFARGLIRALAEAPRSRGAEPDLHADAGLRRPARPGRPRRFLPAARRRRSSTISAGTRRSTARSRSSNGRSGSPKRCPPTGSRSSIRFDPSRGPDFRLADVARIWARVGRAPGAGARGRRRLLKRAGWSGAKREFLQGRRVHSRLRAADRGRAAAPRS